MIEYFPPSTIEFKGGAVLPNAYDAEVFHEKNGQFDLVFKYPLSDNKYKDFKKETIFYADVPHLGKQAFYLSSINKHKDHVEVYAKHIFFLLNRNVTSDINTLAGGDTGLMVVERFEEALQVPHNFTFYSNITERHVFNEEGLTNAFVPLVDGKHSILGQWGGVLVMDNWEVKLMKRFGRDTEYLLAKRKNVNDIEITEDSDQVITRLFLTAEVDKTVMEDGEEKTIKEEITAVIDSPLIDEYSNIYAETRATTDETVVDMDSLIFHGEEIFRTQRIDLPNETFTFDVTDDVKEYEFTIDDTALVYYEDYDLYKRVKVESYRYDPVRERYLEVKFGDKEKTLAQETNDKIKDEIKNDLGKDYDDELTYIEDLINEITKNLGDPEGGVIKFRKDKEGNINEILITDNKDLDKAMDIWRLNIQGISHSNNGINGDFDVAMTQDGKIVADFIATGTLNAALIKAGVLQSLNGNTWIDMKTGYFKLGNITYNEQGFNIRLGGKPIEDYIKDQVPKLDLEGTLADVQDMIDNAIAEGVLNQAEAAAIEKYIKILEKEQLQFNKEFTDLYAETTLPAAYKDNLLEAHTNRLLPDFNSLIYTINQAIASGETTPIQKEEVDSAFDIYASSLINFNSEVDRGWAKIEEIEANRLASGIDNRFSTFDLTLEGLRTTVGDFNTVVDGETRTISSAIGALELTSKGFMTRFDNTEQLIDGLGESVATNASNLQQTATNIRSEVAQTVTGLNRSISDAKRDAINHANDKNDELKDAINADIASIDLDSGYVESLKALKATIRGQKDEIESRYLIVYNDENLLSTYKAQLKEKYDMVIERYDLAVDQINIMIQMDKLTEADKRKLINRLDNFTNSFPDFNNVNRAALKQLDNTLATRIASIDTKADEIDIRVGKKVGMEEVISSINVRDSRINIATENLNLSGDLNLRGKFTNYDSVSGEKAVEITDSKIDFYDYDGSTRKTPVGVLFSSRAGGETARVGTAFNSEANASISIGYAVGTRYSDYMTFNKDGNTNGYPITAKEPMAFLNDARIFGDKRLRLGANSNMFETSGKLVIRGGNTSGFQLGSAADGQIIDWNPSTLGTYPIALRKSTAVLGYFKTTRNALFESNVTIQGTLIQPTSTMSYGMRSTTTYNTTEDYIGDIGSGTINEDGECLIYIDEIYKETANTDISYHVFTQKYNGEIDSIDRQADYFVVYGEAGTEFSWEIKAKKKGNESMRLEVPSKEE